MWTYSVKPKIVTDPSQRTAEICIFLQVLEQIVSENPSIEEVRRIIPRVYKIASEEFEVENSTLSDKYIRGLKIPGTKKNLGTERFAALVNAWLNGDCSGLREVLKNGIVSTHVGPDLTLINRTLARRQSKTKELRCKKSA